MAHSFQFSLTHRPLLAVLLWLAFPVCRGRSSLVVDGRRTRRDNHLCNLFSGISFNCSDVDSVRSRSWNHQGACQSFAMLLIAVSPMTGLIAHCGLRGLSSAAENLAIPGRRGQAAERGAQLVRGLVQMSSRSGHSGNVDAGGGSLDDSFRANFYSTSLEELKSLLKEWKEPQFRAKQIQEWVFDKGVTDVNDMTNLPKKLRAKLGDFFRFGTLRLAAEQVSKDGTQKRAYELPDGQLIESVLMRYRDGRNTACISSQAGCGMGCVFCATGQMGFSRQLSADEIFEQAQLFSSELKNSSARLSNVVMMGMGEPLANYKNVMAAVRRMNTELGIGARHITISTVGLAPMIRKLADEDLQVGLAVSLHQATDEKRSELMPVNKRWDLQELFEACKYYIGRTNRRISFEWALIRGETDSPETAHELGSLLEGCLCHVNVIPLNPTSGFGGKPTPKQDVDRFIEILARYGVACTARTRRGIDIDAGCGMLKADLLKKEKKEPEAVAEDASEYIEQLA